MGKPNMEVYRILEADKRLLDLYHNNASFGTAINVIKNQPTDLKLCISLMGDLAEIIEKQQSQLVEAVQKQTIIVGEVESVYRKKPKFHFDD